MRGSVVSADACHVSYKGDIIETSRHPLHTISMLICLPNTCLQRTTRATTQATGIICVHLLQQRTAQLHLRW